jgi:DNA-binding HxlR family transcriptional regulator
MNEFTCETAAGACRCVASDVFELLGRKYAMDVVCVVASHGTVRFGTVEDHLPDASTSTLSARLSELADAGLVDRERFDEIPPRVEYELSDEGRELAERLRPLAEWAIERADGTEAGQGPEEGQGRKKGHDDAPGQGKAKH